MSNGIVKGALSPEPLNDERLLSTRSMLLNGLAQCLGTETGHYRRMLLCGGGTVGAVAYKILGLFLGASLQDL